MWWLRVQMCRHLGDGTQGKGDWEGGDWMIWGFRFAHTKGVLRGWWLNNLGDDWGFKLAHTLATERMANPAAPSRIAAGTAASGARLPATEKLRTMLVALYSSAASEAAIGGLNQERSADASVTSCTAGCTAWLTVPDARIGNPLLAPNQDIQK